jgi:hypothetical protein
MVATTKRSVDVNGDPIRQSTRRELLEEALEHLKSQKRKPT